MTAEIRFTNSNSKPNTASESLTRLQQECFWKWYHPEIVGFVDRELRARESSKRNPFLLSHGYLHSWNLRNYVFEASCLGLLGPSMKPCVVYRPFYLPRIASSFIFKQGTHDTGKVIPKKRVPTSHSWCLKERCLRESPGEEKSWSRSAPVLQWLDSQTKIHPIHQINMMFVLPSAPVHAFFHIFLSINSTPLQLAQFEKTTIWGHCLVQQKQQNKHQMLDLGSPGHIWAPKKIGVKGFWLLMVDHFSLQTEVLLRGWLMFAHLKPGLLGMEKVPLNCVF